jgi:uncharacterized membrane protein YgcG
MFKWLANLFTSKEALLVKNEQVDTDYEITTGRPVANTVNAYNKTTNIPVYDAVPKVYNPKSYQDRIVPRSPSVAPYVPPAPVKIPPKPVYDYAAERARKAKESQARDEEERARKKRRDDDDSSSLVTAAVVGAALSSWGSSSSSSSDSSSSWSSSSDSSSSFGGGDSGGGGSSGDF